MKTLVSMAGLVAVACGCWAAGQMSTSNWCAGKFNCSMEDQNARQTTHTPAGPIQLTAAFQDDEFPEEGVFRLEPFRAADRLGLIADAFGDGFGGSFSSQTTSANGVTTTNITANGQTYKIVESAQQVEVSYTKTYGPDDHEALQRDFPDLHMHVTGFPETSQGATVKLTVGIETTASAADIDELKEEHPEAYEIYDRFRGEGARAVPRFGGDIEFRGGVIEGFEAPRFEGFRIPREGMRLRVQPDTDDDDDNEEEEEAEDPMRARGRNLIRT